PAIAGTVTVYTDRELLLVMPLARAFERATGHKVVMKVFDRDILDVLLDEDVDSEADVLITPSVNRLDEAYRLGLTIPVESATLEERVPAKWRQSDNHWFATTVRARGIYVDARAAARFSRLTYEDLASPRFKGRICIRSGTHAYNIGLFSAFDAHHSREETEAWLAGLKANLARTPQGNDRAQMRQVAEGMCRVAIANSYYFGLASTHAHQKKWADKIAVVFPRFENGGTHVNFSGMAMLASVDDPEAAQAFMEFQLSQEAQRIYARRNFEFPLNAADVDGANLMSLFPEFDRDEVHAQTIADAGPSIKAIVTELGFND
ncbi:MAG: extracellular solute-binding protein, partial [Pseudomonadota bacterium]